MINYDEIEIVRSNRKTLSLEIKRDLRIIVRVPYCTSSTDIKRFVEKNEAWIEKKLAIMLQRQSEVTERGSAVSHFTAQDIKFFSEKALNVIPDKCFCFAQLLDVRYEKITIKCQRSRWGSCSSKGNLNFNCLLMLCPDDVVDYVVIHELCHLKEMNHSAKFWNEVEKVCPDYKDKKRWLKENGGNLIMGLE